MAGLVDQHFQEIDSIFAAIDKLKAEQKADAASVAKHVDDINEILEQLRIEAQGLPGPKKAEVTAKIRAVEKRTQDEKRSQLLGKERPAKPLTVEEENQDGLEKLKAAHQQLKEDEEVGANTLRELARQREVLERTRNNAREVNSELGKADSLLRKMSKWWRG